uniref:Uncharacterized protein n=1 Tax=Hucho hucho TaxID=62062 RepID=A0A4W5JH79_9TELE
MHKPLEVELTDWQRDQEPNTDHKGFYRTSLPTIITQMLEENARVSLMISKSLWDQTTQVGLYEMENLLNRWVCFFCMSMCLLWLCMYENGAENL